MSDLDNSVSDESKSEIQNVKNGTNVVDVVKDDNKSNDVQVNIILSNLFSLFGYNMLSNLDNKSTRILPDLVKHLIKLDL